MMTMLRVTLFYKKSLSWRSEGVPRLGRTHGALSIGTCRGRRLCSTQGSGGIPTMLRVFSLELGASRSGCATMWKRLMPGPLSIVSIPTTLRSGILT